jgi:phenylacetate-CoA ligase
MDRLPVLSRHEVRTLGEAMVNSHPPATHGAVTRTQTSGSTGMPVTVCQTAVSNVFWEALTLRDHLWQRRNLRGKLAVIRANIADGFMNGWGPPADPVFVTGPCAVLNIGRDIDAQLDWLREQNPDYLLTYPSNLSALAGRALQRSVKLDRLKEIRTLGEMLPAEARLRTREAWDVPVTDVYSAIEVGYVALQCPESGHYHVQAESLIVEVLDEKGAACGPGQVGRVVLTTLHNFATPMIRYEIGDYAEVGAPCPCGRGLPTLRRIAGRVRNMLTLPDGSRRWPSFPSQSWAHGELIRQLQMVQKTARSIEVRVVPERGLTAQEREDIIASLRRCLDYPFDMALIEVAAIPRQVNHKFEEFLSEIA